MGKQPTSIPRFKQGRDGSGRGFGTIFTIIAVIGIAIWVASMLS